MRSTQTATKSSSRSLQLEKACVQKQKPNAAKIKTNNPKTFFFFLKEYYLLTAECYPY